MSDHGSYFHKVSSVFTSNTLYQQEMQVKFKQLGPPTVPPMTLQIKKRLLALCTQPVL